MSFLNSNICLNYLKFYDSFFTNTIKNIFGMLPDSYSNSVQHCKDQSITFKLYRLYTMISFVAYNVVCCDEWESLSLNVFEVEKKYKGK